MGAVGPEAGRRFALWGGHHALDLLIVIVVVVLVVMLRRRSVSRQAGAFKGAIRVVHGHGEVPGLSAKWRHGYGRWVRDILVWYKAPLFVRDALVPADDLTGPARAAEPGEVKRLGQDVTVLSMAVENGARIEVGTAAGERELADAPFHPPRRTPSS